jgi:hypothetical protein
MATHTEIEWTDATWIPVSVCTKLSRGCDNCYAERLAARVAYSSTLLEQSVLHKPVPATIDQIARPDTESPHYAVRFSSA